MALATDHQPPRHAAGKKTTNRQQASGGTRNLWQEEMESSPYTLDEFIVSPRLTWRSNEGSLSLWPSLYHNRGEPAKPPVPPMPIRAPAPGWRPPAAVGRREASQLSIARLRAEGERKTGLGKLSGRVAVMGARREQDTDRIWIDAGGGRTAARNQSRREFFSAPPRPPAGDGMVFAAPSD
ncbi:MAG: hypothetical protein IPL58_15655 [Betaproteobacteria bacterium]|uniref:Uncharacterized protein n=1 Tax=Candidatus Proximibacter danicus TaxID=2954365 RepID=A0A9D7K2R2_9PROT|nr:hypothetical protein [Candidatus Proximibacter danicus]